MTLKKIKLYGKLRKFIGQTSFMADVASPAEAFRFLKGPMDLYNLYKTKYDEEIQNFALQQMGRRRRAEYDDGVPRVKVASPSPNTTS